MHLLHTQTKTTSLHKIGRILANKGPIWKIQNLACSGLRRRIAWHQNDDARDVMHEMTSRVGKDVSSDIHYDNNQFLIILCGCYGVLL